VVSASPGDGVPLASVGEIFSKLVISKNAIVRIIFLNGLMIMEAVLIVMIFSLKGFNGIGGFLKVRNYVFCGNINEEGASTIMLL